MAKKKVPKKISKPRREPAAKKESAAEADEPLISLEDVLFFERLLSNAPSAPIFRVEKWREVYSPNPAMLRQTLSAEGYTVFQWTEFPGRSYQMRKHEPELCHWVIAGSVEIVLKDGGTYVLEAGDRSFMPAETYHSFRVLGEETLLYLIGELRK